MSGSGGFADDGLCNHQNIHNQYSLQQQRLAMAVVVADDDDRTDSDDDDNAALPIPPFVSSSSLFCTSKPQTDITNLDSFLDSITPIVPAQKSSETSCEAEVHPYYCLGDLWETFREWSAYGAGVPFLLYGRHPTTQYYVPFLSGMQLYVDPQKPQTKPRCRGEENGGSKLSEVCAFEYMEQEHPHSRPPLTDKVSGLASEFPELIKYRSCDLSASSWMCVAWYPIYRIPMGPTLKDLEASFLTFHSLSTQPGCYGEAEVSSMSEVDGIRLPVIGMASYKLKGSIISPYGLQECKQENALLDAATNWLHRLQALLPDYQFFLARYS
ncbi:hypothetical protein L6452_04381 [Arctium lappa]|uniref:Uncharacterized protein n=1 Tax=Arctium lappa TaxID=4217 RepID=A0ACB9FQV3_ARCLA|nr:hypothetical protein L6452_04381 [Arctium lappa]